MSEILRHVVDAIGPASLASAEAARLRVAGAGAPMLERLAERLAAAQHAPRPRAQRRVLVVVAGDHGCGDPGIAMGPDHPTAIAASTIATGALAHVARASATPIMLIDAGTREPSHMPPSTIAVGGRPTRNLVDEPAMTVVDAVLGLEAGIALAVSLAEPALGEPLSILALGAIGVGAEVASAALLGAATHVAPADLDDPLAEHAGRLGAASTATGLELLATFGGPETAVLAGLILGAASMNVAVILDSYATGAAALVAASLQPHATGYLVAAHHGSFTQPAILRHLGLVPILDAGLGHGEGTGAAMVLPLVDQVASLASRD